MAMTHRALFLLGAVATTIACGAVKRQEPESVPPRPLPAFDARVEVYTALRQKLEADLPKPAGDDRDAVEARRRALRARLIAAAPEPRAGFMFTPEIAPEFRRRLAAVMHGPGGRNVRGAILDANPSGTHVAPFAAYPDGIPLSTVPMAVLEALPPLPHDLEYRFVDRSLILLDVDPNLVVDVLPDSFP